MEAKVLWFADIHCKR